MEELEQLDSLLNDYENSLNNNDKSFGLNKEEKAKRKFKITSSEETFRFIKTTTGKYYETAYFHEVKIGKYKQKIYCLKNDNQECPLCKKSEAIMAKQHKGKYSELTEEQKEHNKKYYKAAMDYEAKKHFVFEGLDKGAKKDGKKIWLVKENKKKEGVFDKLIPAIKSYKNSHSHDYTSIENGVDMTISSVQDVIQTTKGKYWKVTSITPHSKPSSLDLEDSDIKKILSDKTTWRQIHEPYQIKDVVDVYEMLKLISEGNAPYWDDDRKTFIFPNRPDLQTLYEKKRSEYNNNNTEKGNNSDVDDTDEIANLLENNDGDDLEKELNDIKRNSASLNVADIDDEFDDLPF